MAIYRRFSQNTKTLLFSIIFVCTFFGYTNAQDWSNIQGVWAFSKVEYILYKSTDMTPIDSITVDDVRKLDEHTYPFETVFRRMEISGDAVTCKLAEKFGENTQYILENNKLVRINSDDGNSEPEHTYYAPDAFQLPTFFIESRADRLFITIQHSYGNSRYDFPLTGKMLITLIKQ